MTYIKVDHSKFAGTASAVDTYVTLLKKNMKSANGEVDILITNWQGSDATQFETQWDKVTNKDSTYHKMVKSLESYSDYLKYAADKYKEAQAKAINRANSLPWY